MKKYYSLNEAAEVLGCSYQYLFYYRRQLGFQLPGGRKWFIEIEKIESLNNKKEEEKWAYIGQKGQKFGGAVPKLMDTELENLLVRRTRIKH